MSTAALKARVAELEDEVRRHKERLAELRDEHDQALALITKMREQIEDINAHRDGWIEALRLEPNADGLYVVNESFNIWKWYNELFHEHQKLLREWNKFVGEYNSTVRPRPRGRPLEASEAQVADVLKQRKAGLSLRKIAAATGLGLRTVQTIVAGKERSRELRKREFDKHRARDFRARKRLYDQAARQATQERRECEELIKAAKGLA